MPVPLDTEFSGDIATEVLKRAMTWREALLHRMRTGIGPVGYEKTPTRNVRGAIRKAMAGDDFSMIDIAGLAVDNGHAGGEEKPCSLCEQIDEVMKEYGNG